MNEFRICHRCKKTNIDTLVPRLKQLDPEAKILIACQNFCGIGATKAFAIVNGLPIIATDEDELIQKVQAKIAI